jgi:acyl-CoA thioesterase I
MGAAGRLVISTLVAGMVLAVAVLSNTAFAQSPAANSKPRLKIVALGDSLTAGLGLRPEEAFPVQLQAALKARGRDIEVLNAGVSGDTAGAGLERLDWAVPPDASGVILELGANDALRGLDPAQTAKALGAIVASLRARGIEILLAGMQAPRNLDDAYRNKFDAIFPDLAKTHGLLLRPFFLEGVALDPKLTLPDGLHPTGPGIALIVEGILPDVLRLIERIEAKKKG